MKKLSKVVLLVVLVSLSTNQVPPSMLAHPLPANRPSSPDNGVKIYLPLVGKNFSIEPPVERPTFLRWVKQGEARIGPGETYDRAGAYSPAVIALPEGTYRMYYSGFDGTNSRILSAISSDGRAWTREPGVRVDIWGQYTAVYSPEVIQLANGTYRMYFSAHSSDPLYANIHSATSTDGLHWQVMDGICIEHGGIFDAVLAQSPSMVHNADGSLFVYPDGRYRMYYAGFDGSHFRILAASSQDGLTWRKEGVKLDIGGPYSAAQVTDPEIVQLPDGSFRMFYSGSNAEAGPASNVGLGSLSQPSPMGDPFAGYVILSAGSEDGLQWRQERGIRLRRGDAGRPDSAYLLSPTFAQIGDTAALFYTANDGQVSVIMDAWPLPADADPLSNLQVSRVSVAQAEVTVEYDVSMFFHLQYNLYLTAAVLRQGETLSDFDVPLEPISPTLRTATFMVEYLGNEPAVSDELQVTLWLKTGEICPDPPVCHPVGHDAYSEQFDMPAAWLPGHGGTLRFIDVHEALPRQREVPSGPYLNTRIHYSYYNVWDSPAMMHLEFYDEHGQKIEAIEAEPIPVYPDRNAVAGQPAKGVVRIAARYTGTDPITTHFLKAILRIGYYGEIITETTRAYQKVWNPLATGVISSARWEQPRPHKAYFIVDYEFDPLPGIRQPAWISASILKGGSKIESRFKSSPVPVAAGSGQVTVTVSYTSTLTNYTTDQVRLEMSVPGLVLDESTHDWTISWNPRETGRLSLAPGRRSIREPVPSGSELEVDLQYTYRSFGFSGATIRLESLGQADVRWPYVETPIFPTEDERVTLTLHYRDDVMNVVSKQLKATMVSNATGEVLAEKVIRLEKTWNPPTTGRINSITVERLTDWKAEITVNYDYDSPLDEPAWLETMWLNTPVGDDLIPFGFWVPLFDQTRAVLQEGTGQEISFKAIYTGPEYNLETRELRVNIIAGRLGKRTITYNWLTQTRHWSPPPVGSLEVTDVDEVDDRHINVHVNYSLTAYPCQNPTLRVEVWRNALRGPLRDFQGEVPIQCTGGEYNRVVTVTVPVEYTGDIPYLTTRLLRLKMLVDGVPVELEGGKDFRLEYEFEKEWYTDPPGEITPPDCETDSGIIWISPRELALRVDYSYPEEAILVPSLQLFQDGEEVTHRFEIDIFPPLIRVPPEGKAGSLAAHIWYKNDYLEELVTDEVKIQLNTILGQTRLAGQFAQILRWQHFETEDKRVTYYIDDVDITRPDGVTIEARMNVFIPRDYGISLTLKPLLWRANQPIIPVPEDDPEFSDHAEFLFDYSSDTVWASDGPSWGGPVQATYTMPVGKLQFDAIGFVLYEDDTPLYSRTFPFDDPAQGAIAPPDSILSLEYVLGLPDPDTGEVGMESSFIWNSGELWVLVSYAVNSDTAGLEVWPEPFSPDTDSPFYPFELVSQQSVPAEPGLGLAIFQFRILDSYVDFILQSSDSILWPVFGPASGLVCFNLGVPGQQPIDTSCSYPYTPSYGQAQAADLRRPRGMRQPFPDRLEIFNIDYILPETSGHRPPVWLGAVILKDGEPVSGLSVFPILITDTGRGTVSSDIPLVATYNSSDTDQETVTSDEIMLIMFDAEGEESAPFYRETFPYQHTWTRTPDQVRVVSCVSLPATDTEPPRLQVTAEYTYTVGTAERLAEYGGTAMLWAEGLKLTESVGAYSLKYGIYAPGHGTVDRVVKLQEGTIARTTHVIVYLESFVRSSTGLIRQEGLAQTVVECASLLVNENAFIVATLEEIEVLDDGDTVTPVGEVMLATLGATSPETKESNRWPIERTNARWHEVHDTEQIHRLLYPRFPLFTRRLYQMGPVLGVYVGAIEDDSMPAWVGTLIEVVTKAGALVANCFGQAEIASALEAVGQFTQQLLEKGSMPDLIDVWGVHLPASETWGINEGDIPVDRGVLKKGGKIKPTIRTELITLPSDPKPIRVTLRKIVVYENGDNFDGEVFVHTRVFDGLSEPEEYKFGPRGMGDGDTWTLNKVIYQTDTDRVGPYLYVEVDVWDQDTPSAGDDHEMLGAATWKFGLPAYGSDIPDPDCNGQLAHTVETPSGKVKVCIGIESP